MKRRYKFFLFVTWFLLLYLAITQIAYFLSFHYNLMAWSKNQKLFLPWKIVYWQGNNDYFKISMIFSGLLTLFFLITLFSSSKSERIRKIAERKLTKEERLEYKHLSSDLETKVGLQRLNFTDDAVLNHLKEDKQLSAIGYWSMLIAFLMLLIIIIGISTETIIYIINIFKTNNIYKIYYIIPYRFMLYCVLSCILLFVASFITNVKRSLSSQNEGQKFTFDYLRDYANYCFNSLKKRLNKVMDFLHLNKDFRFTTLKEWKIDHKKTYFRSGIPIKTYKNKMYVDASDSHSLVLGTTNSGKTQSLIAPMIMASMIAGESMIINDIKGELMPIFYHKLKEKGYNIISINFIDPETSSLWNPFSIVIKKYREVEKAYEEKMMSEDSEQKDNYVAYRKEYLSLMKEFNTLVHVGKLCQTQKSKIFFASFGFKNMQLLIDEANSVKIRNKPLDVTEWNDYIFNALLSKFKEKARVLELKKKQTILPPDFSEPLEYLRDRSNTLFSEKDAKNSFFWQQAQLLFEGIILYMLEYEYLEKDEKNEIYLKKLDDDQINFKTIKLFRDELLLVKKFNKNDALINHFLYLKSSEDFSMQRMKGVLEQPSETRANILGTFDTKISIGTLNESISKMTSQSNVDLRDLGIKKTALFIGVHDEKATYYPFVTMLINQAYEEVVKTARQEEKQRLSIPINIIWDEFGISPALNNIDNMLSAMRFRGVRMTMVVQDLSQIDEKYGKDIAKSIKNNVMNIVYLLAGEKETLEYISYRAGYKLQWNKERNSFDKLPIMPADRLNRFHYGEALVLSQRKNPIYTHLLPYTKYSYFKKMGKPSTDEAKAPLPKFHRFLLSDEWDRMCEYEDGF